MAIHSSRRRYADEAGAAVSMGASRSDAETRSTDWTGLSAGQRASARVREKSTLSAAELKRQRDERLHRHLLKSSDGVPPRVATSEEVQQVASLLTARMNEVIADPAARGWYKLFAHMDDDCSGRIDFWELQDMVRNELKVPVSKLSEEQLKAIWRTLDADGSGLVTAGEFGCFMRKGESKRRGGAAEERKRLVDARTAEAISSRQQRRQVLEEAGKHLTVGVASRRERAVAQKALADTNLTAAHDRVRRRSKAAAALVKREREERLNRRLIAKPDGAQLPVATEQELRSFSETLNRRLIEIVEDPKARCWFKMFNHMDDDCSGKISYWEVEDMVRNELKLPKSTISEEKLQALWRSLDEDGSGLIGVGEFGNFMRRGAHVHSSSSTKVQLLQANTARASERRAERREYLDKLHKQLDREEEGRRQKVTMLREVNWAIASSGSSSARCWKSPRALVF